MLTNFFGKSKPITVLTVLVLFLCLFSLAVFNGRIDEGSIKVLFAFMLLFAIVIFIKVKNNLGFDNSYFFLIFVLLVGCFPDVLKISPVFYTNLMLLFFLRKVYSLQSSVKTMKKIFDAGMWLGLSFLIEPFSIVFGFLLYLSVYLHQHLNFKKIIAPFFGFFSVVLLFYTYCFWFDKSAVFYDLFDWYTFYDLSFYNSLNYVVAFSVVAFLTLVSVLLKTTITLSVKNDFRRSWILVLFNLSAALFLLLLVKERDGSEFLYVIFPVSVILTNLVEMYENKWYSDFILLLLVCLSFGVSLF